MSNECWQIKFVMEFDTLPSGMVIVSRGKTYSKLNSSTLDCSFLRVFHLGWILFQVDISYSNDSALRSSPYPPHLSFLFSLSLSPFFAFSLIKQRESISTGFSQLSLGGSALYRSASEWRHIWLRNGRTYGGTDSQREGVIARKTLKVVRKLR